MNRDLNEASILQSQSETTTDIYFKNTYTILSTVAYLLGVPDNIFQTEFGSPRPELNEIL